MPEGMMMGNRANLVLVDRDGWQLRYSHWAGCRMLDALIAGPEMARRYILAQEVTTFWTDELWSDGGLVLDLVERKLLFFGEELMASMNERRAMFDVLAMMWPGYTVSWMYYGAAEIAAYVGAPFPLRDGPWEPELRIAEDTSRLHHLVTVVDDDGVLRCWSLHWGSSAAWHGPSLRDKLPGAGRHAVELGVLPESGVHVDVPERAIGIWLTNPAPGLLRQLGELWPGWRIEIWGDRYEEQLFRCGPSVSAPDLDIASGVNEARSWLWKRIFQSYADSPAGMVASLARMFGEYDSPPVVSPFTIAPTADRPTAAEWARFDAACDRVLTVRRAA